MYYTIKQMSEMFDVTEYTLRFYNLSTGCRASNV